MYILNDNEVRRGHCVDLLVSSVIFYLRALLRPPSHRRGRRRPDRILRLILRVPRHRVGARAAHRVVTVVAVVRRTAHRRAASRVSNSGNSFQLVCQIFMVRNSKYICPIRDLLFLVPFTWASSRHRPLTAPTVPMCSGRLRTGVHNPWSRWSAAASDTAPFPH